MWPLAEREGLQRWHMWELITPNCFMLYSKVQPKTPSQKDLFWWRLHFTESSCLHPAGFLRSIVHLEREREKKTEKEVYPDKYKSRLYESNWIMNKAVFRIKIMSHGGCSSPLHISKRKRAHAENNPVFCIMLRMGMLLRRIIHWIYYTWMQTVITDENIH